MALQCYFCFYGFLNCGRGAFDAVLVDLYQGFSRFLSFLKNNLQNIWLERNFCIPLHSLYKTSHSASYLKHLKKEFFEKIYINREVVQEASVWFYIKWMGKRNEPINSLSLLLRHRLKTIKEQKKRCFLLDTFRISVLKQRLLGEAFGLTWYPLSFITHHLSPKHILQWRV